MQTTYINGYKVTIFYSYNGTQLFITSSEGVQIYAHKVSGDPIARAEEVIALETAAHPVVETIVKAEQEPAVSTNRAAQLEELGAVYGKLGRLSEEQIRSEQKTQFQFSIRKLATCPSIVSEDELGTVLFIAKKGERLADTIEWLASRKTITGPQKRLVNAWIATNNLNISEIPVESRFAAR